MICLFRWPDGTELVRFLDDALEEEWTSRVEEEVRTQISASHPSRTYPFSFDREGKTLRLFLFEPAGGGRICLALFSILVQSDGVFSMFERSFPYFKVVTSPSVTRKTWGLWEVLRGVLDFHGPGKGPRGEGLFFCMGLPWLEPLVKSRYEEPDRWPVTKAVYDKIQYDAVDDFRRGTFSEEVNDAERIRGNQKPPKTIRIHAPEFEIWRSPRPWNIPGPSEHIWGATNFSLDLTASGKDDLEAALIEAGLVFWTEEEAWGRNAFVRAHAEIPEPGQIEQIHLLLGEVPPTMTLSRKELLVFVRDR